MYLQRKVDNTLQDWREEKERKPLLIRGARQVGKTSVIQNLGKDFPHYIELNFEENQGLKELFDSNLSVNEICEQLSLLHNTPIIPGKTLLFLDEIQACKPAISKLRFFYEKMPELHVIAAGSLLEFALAELPSFGVGRIRSLFMYPLSFTEFLIALNEKDLLDYLERYHFQKSLPEVIHQKLLLLHQKFLIIGGMPEVVKAYAQGKTLLDVQRLIDDLIISVQADFDKFKMRFPAIRLIEVFNSIASQMGSKFTYSYPESTLNHLQIKECLHLLQLAGLIYPVTHSAANGIPLGAETNAKKRKFLIYDTGIFQRLLDLEIGNLFIQDDFSVINKGNIAELSVGLELLKNEDPYSKKSLYYWHREARNSQAELDYIYQHEKQLVPIEVKSGTKGRMLSLFLFLKEKKIPFGIRISSENFADMDEVKVMPLYAVHLLKKLLSIKLK
jgi:predicted AAA+ superfamily ATPase